jgi:WD40 repeat protein
MRSLWLVGAAAACLAAGAPVAQAATPGAFTELAGSPFQTNTGSVSSLAFGAGGQWLAVADSSNSALGVDSVSAAGGLAPVVGAPLATDSGSVASVAFSPSGALVATANDGYATQGSHGTVSVYTVPVTGVLAPAAGSPFATGSGPASLAFSPDGGLLAVANKTDATVSVFSVSSGGALSPVPGSPFATGAGPASVAFNPSGGLLAVANTSGGTISVFFVLSVGMLSPVPGSPFASASAPSSLAFSPNGSSLAVATGAAGLSVFSVSPIGALAPVPGSPFPTALPPTAVAFGPNGLLAATEYGTGVSTGDLAVFSVSQTSGLTPVAGSPFATDTNPHSIAFSRHGAMIATGNDGNGGTVSIFASPPQATISSPAPGGTFSVGQVVPTTFSCAESPYGPGMSFCSDSNGAVPARGYLDTSAVGPRAYSVTATSKDGLTSQASLAYTVVSGCPSATGRLAGTQLGPVKLGVTQAAAHAAFGGRPKRTSKQSEYFCLSPTGIWVGYASGRVMWIYTANRHYAIYGIRAGTSLSVARSRLSLGARFHTGANDWYFAANGPATAIIEVRRGTVQAIAIAVAKLAATRNAQRALLRSLG